MSTPEYKAIRVRTPTGWQEIAVKGPEGPVGPRGPMGWRGLTGPPGDWIALTQSEYSTLPGGPDPDQLYVIVRGGAELGSYAQEVLKDGPTCYYRLGDSGEEIGGIRAAHDEMGGPDGEYVGDVDFQADNLLPNDAGVGIVLDGAGSVLIPDNPATRLGDGEMTVETWVRADFIGRLVSAIYMLFDSGPSLAFGNDQAYRAGLRENAAGDRFWYWAITGLRPGSANSIGSGLTGGLASHFVITRTSTHVRMFVDGAYTWSAPATGFATAGQQGVLIGGHERMTNFANIVGGVAPRSWVGAIQEFALYDYALTDQQILDHRLAANG